MDLGDTIDFLDREQHHVPPFVALVDELHVENLGVFVGIFFDVVVEFVYERISCTLLNLTR